MSNKTLTIEQILTILGETPQRIDAVTTGLAPAQLCAAPSPSEWSVNDVLAHLRSCADVWGNCIRTMLAEDHPTLRAVDPRTWTKQTNYPTLEFQPSFRSFTRQRTGLLTILKNLSHKNWARTATVTGAGAVLERTVLSYASRLARHERTHVKQIERIATTMRLRH